MTELNSKVEVEKSKLTVLNEAKEAAEKPEKEAKDKYDEMVKELKAKRENERMLDKSAEAFKEIDADGNNMICLEELVACTSIDGPNQCGVTEAEIKEWFPVDQELLSLESFRELIWVGKLDKLFKTAAEKTQETLDSQKIEEERPQDEFEEGEDSDYESGEENPYSDDDDDDEDDEKEVAVDLTRKDSEDFDVPSMDDEGLKLIDLANAARDKFREQEKVVKEAEREKEELEKDVNLDLGVDKEFYHLVGQCFEYQQNEYTYKFCPFDKGSQKAKQGSEITLGRWGEWSGPGDNKYSQMKLTKGQRCWNGPDRSLTINFECGQQNAVLSTSEPSMCEYVMHFTTPALCNKFYSFEDDPERIHAEL